MSFERRSRGGTFRGWLATITRNKVHDCHRRAQREPRAVGGTEIQLRLADFPGAAEARECESTLGRDRAEQDLLRRALEAVRPGFRPRTWSAFLATAVEGRSPADVGEDLGMSPGAVRVAKSRVLQRLRAELGDLDPA